MGKCIAQWLCQLLLGLISLEIHANNFIKSHHVPNHQTNESWGNFDIHVYIIMIVILNQTWLTKLDLCQNITICTEFIGRPRRIPRLPTEAVQRLAASRYRRWFSREDAVCHVHQPGTSRHAVRKTSDRAHRRDRMVLPGIQDLYTASTSGWVR